ncbi:MAG TPA: regulatory protein RecX [Gaiellaceae bacterium]|nr:regulatory protein RecX [Gaiellaceae bacterium]
MREPDTANEVALRALRHRDLSVRELDERLRARGYGESERDDAIETLVRTGVVDDTRYAESRARQLAARGAGDALIRHTLARAGIEPDVAADALLALTPEVERARIVVERRGAGPKSARYLRGKGFSEEVVSEVVAAESARELG